MVRAQHQHGCLEPETGPALYFHVVKRFSVAHLCKFPQNSLSLPTAGSSCRQRCWVGILSRGIKFRNLWVSLHCLCRVLQNPHLQEFPECNVPDSCFTEIPEHRPVPSDWAQWTSTLPLPSLPSPSGLLQGIVSGCFSSLSFPSFLLPQASSPC